MQSLQIHTHDQQNIAAQFYPCDNAKATVVIASALGVPQSFYRRYANFLNHQGLQCLSFDYRGTGESHYQGRLNNIDLIDWGLQDLNAVLEYAFQLTSVSAKVLFVGHSIGGQMLGMSNYAEKISAVIFIGSSAPYWKRWQGINKLKMFFNSCVLLPVICQFGEVFPAKKIGLSSINLPASVISQWAAWMRDRDYFFGYQFGLDISGYKKITAPLLSYGFDDDNFAPAININWLLQFYSAANIEQRLFKSADIGPVGHMGFFRDSFKDSLWQESADWLLQNVDRKATV